MTTVPLRTLLLEGRESDARLIAHELKRAGFDAQITCVETEEEFLAQLDQEPDIVLSDFTMPQFDAMRALQLLKNRDRDIPFIIISGTIGEDVAVKALQAGATDYVLKDRPARLGFAIQGALDQKKMVREQRRAQAMQNQLTAILEATTDCVFIADPDSQRLVYINRNGRVMIGLGADEDPSAWTISDIHPEWARRIIADEGIPTVLRDGTWSRELAIVSRDGREIPVSLVAVAPRDAAGNVQCLAAIMRNIGGRKQREAELNERMILSGMTADVGLALTQSENLQQMLQLCTETMVKHLDAAFARIWTLNPDDDVLELQASAGMYTHINGGHARVAVGELKIGVIAKERSPLLTNNVQGDSRIGDPQWARREGMIAFAGYPLLIEDRLLGVMAMFARHELSPATLDTMAAVANQVALGIERKLAEQRLRETNVQLESLIDTSPLAIVALDPQFNVLLWNHAAEDIFGWNESEVLGQPLPIVPDDERKSFQAMIEAELAGDMYSGLKLRRLRKDGSLVDVSLWTAPLRDVNGQIIATLRMIADMTEQKKLEEQFRQVQKMEAIGRLAGGIAHDFNNMLTVINAYSEILIQKLPVEDSNRELLQQIHGAGQKATQLTRQLLTFSRKQLIAPEVIDLNTVINDTTNLLQRLIGEDVELTTRLAPAPQLIKADPSHLDQIIVNLAVNARDAMPHGGKLTIETATVSVSAKEVADQMEAKPGPYVMLAMTDTGCGIDSKILPKIFEPFFTSKEPGKGTGLGLATVHGIVQQVGGFIRVTTAVGKGTTITIYIPEPPKTPSARSATDGTKKARAEKESGTILVVEDDDGVRQLTQKLLQARGYTVLEAADGNVALDICAGENNIDLVLTDVVMPRMGGRELRERLLTLRPGLKVLFMSGYTEDFVMIKRVVQENLPILHKPFTTTLLFEKVREVLHSSD